LQLLKGKMLRILAVVIAFAARVTLGVVPVAMRGKRPHIIITQHPATQLGKFQARLSDFPVFLTLFRNFPVYLTFSQKLNATKDVTRLYFLEMYGITPDNWEKGRATLNQNLYATHKLDAVPRLFTATVWSPPATFDPQPGKVYALTDMYQNALWENGPQFGVNAASVKLVPDAAQPVP
jgi:hypothetical protein